jgi:hypothetical protein
MNKRAVDWLGVLMILAVPLLLPFAIGTLPQLSFRFDFFPKPPAALVAGIEDRDGFRIEALVGPDGVPIHDGPSFAPVPGAHLPTDINWPMHAYGTTGEAATGRLWTLMVGRDGEAYLQSPAILIKAGRWVAPNLRVGTQVRRILFVEADAETAAAFAAKATAEDWSPLPRVPDGVRVLAGIALTPAAARH